MSNQEITGMNFPYKTLIWAALALIAIFLFKGELKGLLSNAEELSLFGIDLKVGKEKAQRLTDSIVKYKDELIAINDQMEQQESVIRSLKEKNTNLANRASSCPQVRGQAEALNADYQKVLDTSNEIKSKTASLREKYSIKKVGGR